MLAAMVIGVASMLVGGCGGSNPRAPAADLPAPQSEDIVERLRAAALEYERARAVGDPLAMARAAAARQPIDRMLAGGAPADGADFLTARQMFSAARVMARDDGERLRSIDAIEAESAKGLLGGLPSFAKRIQAPKPDVRSMGERETVFSEGQPIPRKRLPLSTLPPNGSVVTVGARESIWMRAQVAAGRTLFVYAESKAGAAVRLRIVDADRGTVVCDDAQEHGFLVCKWRVEAAATGVVEVSNTGENAAAVLLIAHQ